MSRALLSSILVAALCVIPFFSDLHAQPTLTPPVTLGPKTLEGFGGSANFHEFFTQPVPFDWKGNIGGIFAGEEYWIYIVGIDATDVTGPNGRQIKFNLQDAEDGSSFKHLGISFSLNNPTAGGGDLLECYQLNGNRSTHGLNPGELTTSNFDLRFRFRKESSGDAWDITPYFRLQGGEWTEFFDGGFLGGGAFDFQGAKLTVGFDNPVDTPADGEVSFDNYYLLGPIAQPITEAFVNNDW